MNYKKLWESFRKIDGHRILKPYSKYPNAEYKTIKECMNGIERLYKIKRLKDVLDGLDKI